MTTNVVGTFGEGDDLLSLLGVVLPKAEERLAVTCGAKAPRAKAIKPRFTEWSNAASFTFGGYLARLTAVTCEACGELTEVFEGVYTEEIAPNGTRRLQALGRGMNWPANEEHRLEVEYKFTPVCGKCVRGLGFSREVEKDGRVAFVIKE